MPKYSIILPVRNGGEYVKECVHSILAQTLQDFTLQVLDNCSTDGTLQWLESLHDSRIELHPSTKPLTIEENWARITAINKNEFITLIGHDDVLDKDYLSVVDKLVNSNPEATLFLTHFRYINANGGTIRRCKPMADKLSASQFLAFFLTNLIDSMGTGFMMRSKDYDSVGGIPLYPNLLFADFELWISLIRKGSLVVDFAECFSFRLHQSMTTSSSTLKFKDAFTRFLDFLLQLKQDPTHKEVIERYAINFITFYTKGLSHRLLRTSLKERNGLTVTKFVEECKTYADKILPSNNFDPYADYSMKLARQIDSNAVGRYSFLMFKKIYSKPLYQ